jgi:predicted hotdog family 3-hydroxylacyl-ACP dehydratase
MAPAAELPPISELVPHAGAMCWLDRVRSHEDDETVCEAAGGAVLFRDAAGDAPAFVALEYMAQGVAAHAGLVGRAQGRPALGLLVGCRDVVLHVGVFRAGQRLHVTARRVWGKLGGMAVFDCRVSDAATGTLLASGRLQCVVPPDGAPAS